MLALDMECRPDCTVAIAAVGEVDAAAAARLSAAVHRRLDCVPSRLVLDLREVTFLGVAGLRVLLCLADRATVSGVLLRLVYRDPSPVQLAVGSPSAGQEQEIGPSQDPHADRPTSILDLARWDGGGRTLGMTDPMTIPASGRAGSGGARAPRTDAAISAAGGLASKPRPAPQDRRAAPGPAPPRRRRALRPAAMLRRPGAGRGRLPRHRAHQPAHGAGGEPGCHTGGHPAAGPEEDEFGGARQRVGAWSAAHPGGSEHVSARLEPVLYHRPARARTG
jgi:anti-anti-sigma factor